MAEIPRKALFAAVPLRAIGDPHITDAELRDLAAIAAYDRLSHAIGKGQGAWASHQTMATWLGRNYTNFSTSINKLLRLGYLVREPLASDRRRFTYRVVYNDEDRLPSAENVCSPTNHQPENVCSAQNETPEIVCPDPNGEAQETANSSPQYIPQSVEINSAEAGKINSAKAAHIFDARGLLKRDHEGNVGGSLALFERAFRADPESIGDIADNIEWLTTIIEDTPNEALRQQATRLIDDLEIWADSVR